jgi:16S rRNA (uracil1498-N3)-methyltransferase
MDCFYVDPKNIHGTTLLITDDEYKHLARVLRKNVGDRIAATDGNDRMFTAVIRSLDHGSAECEVLDAKTSVNEPRLDITVAISLLKSPGRMDFFVEKATEFGARTIIPILCERTIPRHEKHARLEKIALAAMKQCGRSYVPRLFVLTQFETLVQHADAFDVRLIPHEKTEQSQFIGSVLQHHPNAYSLAWLGGGW